MRIYFFPSYKKNEGGVYNPYSKNFKDELATYGEIVNTGSTDSPKTIDLLKHIFDADIYFYNWVESIPFLKLGVFQTFIFLCCILILKLRNKKIIWIFHNITPHNQNNKLSKFIIAIMLKHSDLIITHSKDALNYLKSRTTIPTYFFNHPLLDSCKIKTKEIDFSKNKDILIWGTILKYKGIVEFLEYLSNKNFSRTFKINIIGKCSDKEYDTRLKQFCNEYIHYENRVATFEELNKLIQETRYVLFPYLPESVSSSGTLIDTIVMGGVPLGPNIGAFKDLQEEGVCLTYKNYDELILILKNDVTIDTDAKIKFINSNTWNAFVSDLWSLLKTNKKSAK